VLNARRGRALSRGSAEPKDACRADDGLCGRAASETVGLEVADIDSGRVVIRVEHGISLEEARRGERRRPTVRQVTAIGPLGLEYLNAKDDPRSASRGNLV
jgi:hypothetical protein